MYIAMGFTLAFIIIVGSCTLQLLTGKQPNQIQQIAMEKY